MQSSSIVNNIWNIAELLRGDYKQSEYGRIVLPFTLLRRLDCMLEPTKEKVLEEYTRRRDSGVPLDAVLLAAADLKFYNTSPWNFAKLKGDPNNIRQNLLNYVDGFTEQIRDIFERFNFQHQVEDLDRKNLLFLVVSRFAEIDMDPKELDSMDMSLYYEELIRRFSEISNETAGEHFTPREVIRLMVNLLFTNDDDALRKPGVLRTVYDPAAGTGGMLSIADETIKDLNPEARLVLYGQELNAESYAICKSELLIKEQDPRNIIFGNTLSEDGHHGRTFDYMLSNPPFGVEWKKIEDAVKKEYEQKGFNGRFGPGLPRISDGSLLFLLHLLSKMNPVDNGGSRIGIVFNGSPLFTGAAGSGESEIRKWIIENDWLEAIIGLPTDMFYNTGIATYIWILSNRKEEQRKGKIQLIDATQMYRKMRKSLGSKRNELSDEDIENIVKLYGTFDVGEKSKIFDNDDFGYSTITIERPLRLNFQASPERIARLREQPEFRKNEKDLENVEKTLSSLDQNKIYRNREEFTKDLEDLFFKKGIPLANNMVKTILQALSERDETADICLDRKGMPEPDPELRDRENVPLKEDIQAYFEREVKPYVQDAWIDFSKTKVGYEIPFTRHFYKYVPPRPLEEIDADLKKLGKEIIDLLGEITELSIQSILSTRIAVLSGLGRYRSIGV